MNILDVFGIVMVTIIIMTIGFVLYSKYIHKFFCSRRSSGIETYHVDSNSNDEYDDKYEDKYEEIKHRNYKNPNKMKIVKRVFGYWTYTVLKSQGHDVSRYSQGYDGDAMGAYSKSNRESNNKGRDRGI